MSGPAVVRRTRLVAVSGVLMVASLIAGLPTSVEAAALVMCGGEPATIVGTPGDETIEGTSGPDVISGRGGDDVIRGLEGDDVICGGAGRDVLRGGPGDDVVFGGGSPDRLRGGAGHDVIYGGGGDDELRGGPDGDLIFGNSGVDTLRGGRGVDVCRGGPGDDSKASCNEPATVNVSSLQIGESLLAGHAIVSPNGAFAVTMNFEGNVVLNADGGAGPHVLWDTDTNGHSGARLTTTVDGNLAVVHRGAVVWQTGTEGDGVFAKVTNNANLVVVSSGQETLWDRRSNPGVPDWHLPWPVGESWKAGAPHGTNNGSLDFGPADGAGDITAIASGTVGWFQCESDGKYLQIEHGDGWMSTYYHLGQIRTELIGEWVEAGTIVGVAAQAVPCGGRSTFPHVHLVIWRDGERQTADGLSIGGYTVHAGSRPYWGHWTDDSTGETVVVNEDGAACCLTNSPESLESGAAGPGKLS
ncbi:MAG: peptidoglycan DD-metalloendopeptidase family protein [bacterium]|nr:peptidoglycan DD-metalloendopeptidase family protein [bacterium]